ncbi:hypothetical protein [Amycolatopsis sp. NPDC051071]|uniref:hypothetical protein n=1 Tax=Amycolatopsis sp. NPDC051071 TaxID=3154637 RepID=UPI003434F38D
MARAAAPKGTPLVAAACDGWNTSKRWRGPNREMYLVWGSLCLDILGSTSSHRHHRNRANA